MSLAYLADDRAIELRGSIALTDSTTLSLSGANIMDYEISEQCTSGQELTVGDTRAATFRLTVADEAHALTVGLLLGAQVSVECRLSTASTWDKLGVWFIDDCDISRQSAAVKISGSDALATKFDADWTDPTYPVTLGNLLTRCATLAGVSTKNAGSFRGYSRSVSGAPAWPEGTTIRKVVSYIAQCAGGFARIDRAGKLEIVAYDPSASSEAIGPGDFFRLRMGAGAAFSFNAILVMEMGATEYTRYSVDSSVADSAANSIRIARNPLMTPTIASALVTALTGLTMQAVRVEWVGDPTVSCGSSLEITDTDEAAYTAVITQQTLTISGGMSANSACELPSLLEKNYQSGAVLAPDGKLSKGAIADGSIDLVKIAAGAQQALILAAGEAIDIGGTNLVPYTGWYASIGTGWTFTDNTGAFARYPASTGHPDIENSFGGNGFLYWNATSTSTSAGGAGKAWSSHFRVVPGEQYTVSLRYRATGLMCILTGRTAKNVDPTWAPDFTCPDTNNDTDFSATVTVPAGIVWMQVVLRCNTNSAGEVGRVKVERGNRATAWSPCPNDPSENVVIGSRIALTQERILLQSPEIYINVSGTAGDTTIDESGMTTPVVNSPSVAPRYTGPTAITVTQLTGKNKLNYTAITWTTGRRDSSGAFVVSSVSHYSSAVSVSPSTTYTLSGSLYKDSKAFRLYYLQADGTWISQTAALDSSNIPYTFTTPANCRLIQIQGSMLVTLNDAQLELGSGATTYEQYTGIPLDGINAFRTLTDAFAALTGKWLDKSVTVTLATDTAEPGRALLSGVSGSGMIDVNLNGRTVGGTLRFEKTTVELKLRGGTITSAGSGSLVELDRVTGIYVTTMSLVGTGSIATGLAASYSRAALDGCGFYGLAVGVSSSHLSNVEVVNAVGSVATFLRMWDGGRIAIKGTAASYTTLSAGDGTGILTNASSGSAGGTAPSTPTGTTTVTASSVSTRTYQPSGSGWINSDTSMQQGRNAGYNHYGIIWFGTTGWSGETIAAATLTLRRLSGGAGGSVTVRLKTVTVSSASGDPNNSATDYGAIGTIEQGQTAAFSLPVAAVQAIASGNAKGFMLYSDDSSNWGDRSFSRNYAMFAGSGNSSYKPSLSVTYNT